MGISWMAIPVSAQYTLQGWVMTTGGEPLAGASVVLAGTYYGMPANGEGAFAFRHLKPGDYVLEVSFIGFERYRADLTIEGNREVSVVMVPAAVLTGEVMVQATRAGEKTPVAYSNLSGEVLQDRNMGQDLPFLLSQTPSLVATSDAGTGIGYTTFRVRGTDMNRMNITVNGIPLNDAESHSTYFVDQPDLASSADRIQIQRGAGTSTNGGAAFGATINLQTLDVKKDPYARYAASAGSFRTWKNTFSAGTGLVKGRFSADARLSSIRSDGFIDRAFSNLRSWYLSAGSYSATTVLRLVAFSGQEETYQAWNGVPSVRLRNDVPGMQRYLEHGLYSPEETKHLLTSGSRTFNLYTYPNQVDNYLQSNYQLHFFHRFNQALNLHTALHYTLGKGYYEQYRARQKFSNYGLPEPEINGSTLSRADLVRRKWLDNDFGGLVFAFSYRRGHTDFSWGGGLNHYIGNHFGRIIWGSCLGTLSPDYEWYRNRGKKTDLNSYAKISYQATPSLNLYGDLQYRHIDYRIDGGDDDLRELAVDRQYGFFNPKAGLFWQAGSAHALYLSFARTHREPNRDNFTDTPPGGSLPLPERLNDLEAGWTFRSATFTAAINLYGMFYDHQLVLTGQINDVGAPVMTNVESSYRAGAELSWGFRPLPALRWDGNATFSRNRIRGFTEFVDDWDQGGQQSFTLGTTNLSFSPALLANSQLSWNPGRYSLKLLSQYTGKQYIDNSRSADRILDAWFVNHLQAEYTLTIARTAVINFYLQVNNLLDEDYESNAWVYSYLLGGTRYKMDGYFPQAGRNFMAGITLSF